MNPVTKSLRDYHFARLAQSRINKVKNAVDARVRELKADCIRQLDDAEMDGADVTVGTQRMHFSRYEFKAPVIQDRAAFEAWALADDSEAFFEPERRVRMDVLGPIVKQRYDDGEPLPPGVGIFIEERLSRTAKS